MAKVYLDSNTRTALEKVVKTLNAKNPTPEAMKEARKLAPQLKSLLVRDDVRKTKTY